MKTKLLISGFTRDIPCLHFGSINGQDFRRCGCCGGWIIEVNNQTFLADSIPNAEVIMGNAATRKFPIPVYLNYKMAAHCSDRKIVITCIQKRK